MINLLRDDLDDFGYFCFLIKIVPILNWLEMVFVMANQIMPTAILMVVIAQQQHQLQPSQLCQQLMTQVIIKKFFDPFCFAYILSLLPCLLPLHKGKWVQLNGKTLQVLKKNLGNCALIFNFSLQTEKIENNWTDLLQFFLLLLL